MKAKKSYSEKLRDPRWQKKRLEVLERNKFTCQDCGSADKELHVHHCYYESGLDPWEYEDLYLKCLCGECHKRRHEWSLNMQKMYSVCSPNLMEDLTELIITIASISHKCFQNGQQFPEKKK